MTAAKVAPLKKLLLKDAPLKDAPLKDAPLKDAPLNDVLLNDVRWQAVCARDAKADARFFYAVETTGVYCRPSCGARLPRPEHVSFHPTTAAAQAAGFRACRRCKPEQPPRVERQAALVVELCRLIEQSDVTVKIEGLAKSVGLSPSHVHRVFKSVTGVTPRAYGAALRAQRARRRLEEGVTITEAIHEAGYGAASRFYETSTKRLGMTPGEYQAGAAELCIRFAVADCSLGALLVATTVRGVCSITLGDDPDALIAELEDRYPQAELIGGDADFESLVARVVGLVAQPGSGPALPLDIQGTAFQQRVWQALIKVPVGTTVTYTELAKAIGAPKSIRAVANACGQNPVAVAVPCHRVIRKDGSLSGYRWGISRKRALLESELKLER